MTAAAPDQVFGYASYRKMAPGETISGYYSKTYGLEREQRDPEGRVTGKRALRPEEVAFYAKIMLAVILLAALFWATGAITVAITAMLVAVIMYLFGIFEPNDIAQAFAKDAVIFIFGVLALAKALTKLGAFGYLPKPYELDRLLERLREAYTKRLKKKLARDQQKLEEIMRIATGESPLGILRRLSALDDREG